MCCTADATQSKNQPASCVMNPPSLPPPPRLSFSPHTVPSHSPDLPCHASLPHSFFPVPAQPRTSNLSSSQHRLVSSRPVPADIIQRGCKGASQGIREKDFPGVRGKHHRMKS
ncbi:hypothetical protein E2C01_064550 [Portunus trituberculatus]|uniref:Uncharacterized protein n=1 Tax=Portunus trituberculatus TaxID=210409 RepID=A0A5B7HK26_PORTR|nr:hypothetical protein [Portunus trituberculatus]